MARIKMQGKAASCKLCKSPKDGNRELNASKYCSVIWKALQKKRGVKKPAVKRKKLRRIRVCSACEAVVTSTIMEKNSKWRKQQREQREEQVESPSEVSHKGACDEAVVEEGVQNDYVDQLMQSAAILETTEGDDEPPRNRKRKKGGTVRGDGGVTNSSKTLATSSQRQKYQRRLVSMFQQGMVDRIDEMSSFRSISLYWITSIKIRSLNPPPTLLFFLTLKIINYRFVLFSSAIDI